MESFKESAMRVRQGDVKPTAKIMATQHIERGNMKKTLDLLKHIGKKVKIDKSAEKTSKAIWTIEGTMNEMKLPISDEMFKSLKKGDKIKINFDSSIKKGNQNTYVVMSKSKSAKYNLEKIKLKNVANPVAQASFLYNRQGKVTMAQGDMAVTMNTAVKEATILRTKTTRQQSAASKEKDRKNAVKTLKDIRKGKYPGVKMANEDVVLEEAMLNEFSDAQLAQLKKAYADLERINVTSPTYKKLKAMIAKMDVKALEKVARAKVRFVSQIAAREYEAKSGNRLKAKDYMESTELEEKRDAGKSATGYDIYHNTYSGAMQHAYAHAKKKHGVTVSSDDIDSKVASGPRKPSTGKTVSHILGTDKKQNLHVQVYNTGRKYELNMYVESVELDEANLRKMDHDEFMKHGDSNPKGRADPAWNAERKRRYRNAQAKNYKKMKKESVELDEAIDFRKAFMDIQSYAKKSGGMDKTDFEKVAYYVKAIGDNQNSPNVANKAFMTMKKHIAGLDTDVRDGIHGLLKKHGMVKNGRMVQEGKWFVRQSAKPNKTGTYQGKKFDDGKKAIAQARKDWKLTPDEHMSAKMMKEGDGMKTFESIRRGVQIAKKSGGAMTPAAKKIDKIKKGLSDNPRVRKALNKANEESD